MLRVIYVEHLPNLHFILTHMPTSSSSHLSFLLNHFVTPTTSRFSIYSRGFLVCQFNSCSTVHFIYLFKKLLLNHGGMFSRSRKSVQSFSSNDRIKITPAKNEAIIAFYFS